MKIGRLPMWNADKLIQRVAELRSMGAERICFKTGPFDPKDMIEILKIASEAGVDLLTFDGAGGGSGKSPVKMMNEWGSPTVYMESMLYDIMTEFRKKELLFASSRDSRRFYHGGSSLQGIGAGRSLCRFHRNRQSCNGGSFCRKADRRFDKQRRRTERISEIRDDH